MVRQERMNGANNSANFGLPFSTVSLVTSTPGIGISDVVKAKVEYTLVDEVQIAHEGVGRCRREISYPIGVKMTRQRTRATAKRTYSVHSLFHARKADDSRPAIGRCRRDDSLLEPDGLTLMEGVSKICGREKVHSDF
jgi:hypothetical protein